MTLSLSAFQPSFGAYVSKPLFVSALDFPCLFIRAGTPAVSSAKNYKLK